MMEIGGVAGTHFLFGRRTPNACLWWATSTTGTAVSNDAQNDSSGIWEIFIPHVGEAAHYKIEVRGPHGDIMLKTDPFALFAQHGTQTGCMVLISIATSGMTRAGWSGGGTTIS